MSKLAEYRAILENQNRIYGVHVIRSDVNVLGRDIDHITEEIVELKANMSEVKGDIKALNKSFETMQTRFGWGLVILGILITVLQFLK